VKYPYETHGARLLLGLGEYLSAQEVVAVKAKDPLWLSRAALTLGSTTEKDILMNAELFSDLATVLRTAGYFVFGEGDVWPSDADDLLPFDRDSLPPLPFPRMWLEMQDPQFTLSRVVDLDGRESLLLGYGVIEIAPSSEWRIIVPMVDRERALEFRDAASEKEVLAASLAVRRWHLQVVEGRVRIGVSEEDVKLLEQLAQQHRLFWERFVFGAPELMVQLIHLSGANVQSVRAPRPRRREFQRRFGVEHPSVYWVHLGGATDAHPGSGDRLFHHRWLVRGHYRLDPRGSHDVPGKGICAWVRPYVKGPEDAPWKGRPAYATATADIG
jgi:hypothetical protein